MKLTLALAALAIPAVLIATPAAAEDAVSAYEISNVMSRPEYAGQLQGVRFYFGDSPHPPAARTIERNVQLQRRTRKFGRTPEEACQWVMLSALLSLRQNALRTGGNAVVNIRSNWNNLEWSSRSQYQCGVGFLNAGVALKGDVVRLP
jgi:hypothetical protein